MEAFSLVIFMCITVVLVLNIGFCFLNGIEPVALNVELVMMGCEEKL